MNKLMIRIIVLLLCLGLIAGTSLPAYAHSAQDDTLAADTVTISTAEEFIEFSENCRLNSYSFGLSAVLTADIDLSDTGFECIPSFSGIFDGGGHTVSGLSLTTNGSVQGLFRYLRVTAVVRDLTVEGEIEPGGSHSSVGGLAGRNAGQIINCRFSGKVSGSEKVGGLVGLNELTGIIDGCTTAGDVHGDHFVGGVTGENRGVVRECINLAQVNVTAAQNSVDINDITVDSLTGSEFAGTVTDVGGIAGNSTGVIRDCSNQGPIGYPRIGYNVGGIAGSQIGYITGCLNSGDVYGRKEVGGIVGQMEPGTVISYEEDALQTLHGQLEHMSSLMNSASAVVESSSAQFSSNANQLQGHLNGALDAMEQLMPDGSGVLPDADSASAALNNLSGAMSSINGTVDGMAASGQESVNALTDKLGDLLDQIYGIGETLNSAADNLGGTVMDISDADTEKDTLAKVESCTNTGSVDADVNAGGIVGAVSVENDLDPDDNLSSTGKISMNADCEMRAVVLRCENMGKISVARQNAGGIAGWMTMGLLRECRNTGAVDAAAAKYIGGIAGQSSGFIRDCGVKCRLDGAGYVGGVAGQSDSTVSDCRSMVRVGGAGEKAGAVLGYSEKVADGRDDACVTGNYYFAIDRDIGGVDGISYAGAAQALSREEFFALEDLHDIFDSVTVRFVFEDGTSSSIELAPGAALEVGDIPTLPEKTGYVGYWEGMDEFDLSVVAFDTELSAVYEPIDSALQSLTTGTNGMPVLLALGEFTPGEVLEAAEVSDAAALEEGVELIECWKFSLSGAGHIDQLRCRLPEGEEADSIRLSVGDASGNWETRTFSADGSYIVFTVEDGESVFRFDREPDDHFLEYAVVGASLLLVIITSVGIIINRRKKADRRC